MMNAMNATVSEKLTPEQVYDVVQELRSADYNKVGDTFFLSRVNRLAAAGWVLGTLAYSHKVHQGRRGYVLRHPRNEWRNTAYFFNVASKMRVFYWDNAGDSKRHAQDLTLRQPAPKLPHGQYFATYNKPTTAEAQPENSTVVEAAQGLMEAMQVADKQWIGLNMLDPGQKRAHEILSAARIRLAKALANRIGTHTGQRVPHRGTCEKCNTPTYWVVDV